MKNEVEPWWEAEWFKEWLRLARARNASSPAAQHPPLSYSGSEFVYEEGERDK